MKTTLTIPLLNGETWTVDAQIVGELALHRARKAPANWSVTNVPTLLTFVGAMPVKIQKANKPIILAWMKKVQAEPSLAKDWLAMRKFDREQVMKEPEFTHAVRSRIREYCLKMEGV